MNPIFKDELKALKRIKTAVNPKNLEKVKKEVTVVRLSLESKKAYFNSEEDYKAVWESLIQIEATTSYMLGATSEKVFQSLVVKSLKNIEANANIAIIWLQRT